MINAAKRGLSIAVGCGIVFICVLLVLNLTVVKGGDSSKIYRGDGYEHFYMVTRSAISVANPDIRVNSAPVPERPADMFSVRVAVEPQWARPGRESSLIRTYEINRSADNHETYVKMADGSSVRQPVFPPSRIKSVLKIMKSAGAGDKKKSKEILRSLGRNVSVTAIIQYADSASATDRGSAKGVGGNNILISSDSRTSVPLYWDSYLSCEERKVSEKCGELTQFEEFRRWVSQLKPEDERTLSAFGLNLWELRDAAHRGRIIGHIEVNTDPAELRNMLHSSRVQMIYIVEVRLNCAFGSQDICEPEAWPDLE